MKICVLLSTIALLFAACGDDLGYDAARLEQFRKAIPDEQRLTASTPSPAPGNAVGDDPIYVGMAANSAQGLNQIVRNIIGTLDAVTRVPPTVYNSETDEFLWGPWNNDDGFGEALVYIRKEPAGADFEYSYAFVRTVGNDVATWAPIIWGGATPDPDNPELGSGVTLFDFEANYDWEVEHVPGGPTGAMDRGRFLTVYGNGTEGADTYAFNIAMMRGFIPNDGGTNGQAIDSDTYYGRYYNGTDDVTVDFFNWHAVADFCDASAGEPVCFDDATVTDAVNETIDVRLAAVNEGVGRAEALVSGGDLGVEDIEVLECWDSNVARTYLRFDWTTASAQEPAVGDESLCGPIFENSLDVLGLGTLDTSSADYIGMDCVGRKGIGHPDCE